MRKVLEYGRENFTELFLSVVMVLSLLNPVFKKYDYGAGWPMVLGFVMILGLIALREWRESKEGAKWEQIYLWIFMIFVALSFVFSQTRNLGFSEVMAYVSMGALYLLLARQKIRWGEVFLRVIASVGLVAVIWGYLQYLLMPETRMFGPFMNIFYHANEWPNAFALMVLMIWPLYPIVFRKHWGVKEAILLGFVLSSIPLSYSRGAAIAFVGQVVLLGVLMLRRISWKQIGLAILSCLVMVGMFLGANNIKAQRFDVLNLEEKLEFENSESLTSKTERKDFWLGAIDLTLQKPLLGWGPFSFRQAYNQNQATLLGASDHPHNIFLKIGAENGVVALLAFILFLGSVLTKVVQRWSGLSKDKQLTAALLMTALGGAFAHNLIDYNFNFLSNLLLLWVLLILLRSTVVKTVSKKNKEIAGLILTILLVAVAVYEAGILVLQTQVYDKSYLQYSLFPRNVYLDNAEMAIAYGADEVALSALDKELRLNSLDAQAYYLKGVVYCRMQDLERCQSNMQKAIELNPKNELRYYNDYYREFDSEEILSILPLIEEYFLMVENNVHFTAYTGNVEAAAELARRIVPYLPRERRNELVNKIEAMLNKANELRELKKF